MSKKPSTDLIRLSDIIAPGGPLPISRSTWFAWQKDKSRRVPTPIHLGPRITAYRRADIDAFVADPENWTVDPDPSATLRNAKTGDR